MQIIPNGTKVYVDASNGAYPGTVLASGTQATLLFYQVQLDDVTGWPDEISEDLVVVPEARVRTIVGPGEQLLPLHGFTSMQTVIASQPTMKL
jgi:hypothetical protein